MMSRAVTSQCCLSPTSSSMLSAPPQKAFKNNRNETKPGPLPILTTSAEAQINVDLLAEGNKTWAKNASVLVVFVSRKMFDHNDATSITHSYDTGADLENFV